MVGVNKLNLVMQKGHKAGMEGLDEEKINKVIEEATKGSKFYAKKKADQARTSEQVKELVEAANLLSKQELDSAGAAADAVVEKLRRGRRLDKVIVHIDMDMFYAAVEMRDQSHLKEKPMAVGTKAMLTTSNYKARKFGVRSAMPGFIAKKLCPHLTIVPPNMAKYAAEARRVRKVLAEFDSNFLPVSLDEAYLDITSLVESRRKGRDRENAEEAAASIVSELRAKIETETGLTASAGIACNKRLAKVASDMNKPNGQLLVAFREEEVVQFAQALNIRKIGGIGSVSEQLLNGLGVNTCGDLYQKRAEIKLLFSNLNFEFYMEASQGLGETSLQSAEEREQKTVGVEKTFKDTSDKETLLEICHNLSKDLAKELREKELTGSAVTVVIKTDDFKQTTRVGNLLVAAADEAAIFESAKWSLLHLLDKTQRGQTVTTLRMMGVRMAKLMDNPEVRNKHEDKDLKRLKDPRVMERKGAAGPEAGGIKEALVSLVEKKSKLADKLADRKSKLGDCPNLFAANFKAARGVAAKGWESSSQSQEEAETGKQQQRMRKPGVEKNQEKKVRRNLFGKQQSFQNVRVLQEMQQKKRELGELQRSREESKENLKEGKKESLKSVKGAKLEHSNSKPEDETTELVFPASPTKSVRQSQVASWVQQALPSLAMITSHENKALGSRSPRGREKSSAGKAQEVSKWVAYQRVRAGRRPSRVQQGTSGREGRRSRGSLRERQKQAEKPFDLFKDHNQCSFFDSIETKDKGEGPLDFLFADGDTNEEPTVTELWGDDTGGLEAIRPQEWEASETVGDGRRHNYGAGWNQQNSGWSHSRKRGGFAQQAGGDSWGDNFLQGRPGNVANSGWMMGEEPAQERRNLWDSNVFGQPEIRRHQPVASKWMPSTGRLAGGYLNENDLDMASNVGRSVKSPFDPRSDAFMESEDDLDIAAVATPRFMW